MTYKTFRRICTALLISLALMLEVKAQNIPVYGNLTPSDSGALDLGRNSLRWDTIFVDAIYPPVSGSGIWSEINDSAILFTYGGDSVIITIDNGVISYINEQSAGMELDAAGRVYLTGTGIYNMTGTATQQAQLNLREDTDNGTNNVTLQSPASLAADYTLTFPANDGNNRDVLRTNGTGTLSWVPNDSISPWTNNGSNVYLRTLTDSVSIGASTNNGAKLFVSDFAIIDSQIIGNNDFVGGLVIGKGVQINSPYAIAIGTGAYNNTNCDSSLSIGVGATISGGSNNSIAIGTGVNSGNDYGISIGYAAQNPGGANGIAIGTRANSINVDGIAIGRDAIAAPWGIALGSDASADANELFISDSISTIQFNGLLGTQSTRIPEANFVKTNTNEIAISDTTAPAAQIATLTNFPVAGDPVGFLNVEIPVGSGVIRKIPYW